MCKATVTSDWARRLLYMFICTALTLSGCGDSGGGGGGGALEDPIKISDMVLTMMNNNADDEDPGLVNPYHMNQHYKDMDAGDPALVSDFFLYHNTGNVETDPMLTDPYNMSSPDFAPQAGSPCLGVAWSGPADTADFTFDDVTFIGAMDDTTDWTAGWTIAGSERGAPAVDPLPVWNTSADFTDSGSGDGAAYENDGTNYTAGTYLKLTGAWEGDVDLSSGPMSGYAGYFLDGGVFIGDVTGAESVTPTLTIPAGAVIYGIESVPPGMLVICRGAMIDAQGTSGSPIVFTSPKTSPAAEDWGGLVINGSATINAAGGEVANGEGNSGPYGGGASPDDADNSGILEYVVIAYAGHVFTSEDELNGIAMQGVGNGTTVDYVQIHKNKDDGIEFFGGTVNVKHVVCTGIGDDSFDWTQGWTGKAQYVVLQQYDWDADQGIEADNNGSGHDLLPRAMPTIANITIIGQPEYSGSDIGILMRAGTGLNLYGGIIMGFNDAGLDIDDSATWENAYTDNASGAGTYETLSGDLTLTNCIIWDNGVDYRPEDDSATAAVYGTGAWEGPGTWFDTSTTYIGALDSDTDNDWTLGWTIHGYERGAPAVDPLPVWNTSADFTDSGSGDGEAFENDGTNYAAGTYLKLTGAWEGDLNLSSGPMSGYTGYFLDGGVFIGDTTGAESVTPTLTIPAGTVIYGIESTPPGMLVICRGAMIDAQGTADAPIVFTSPKKVPAAEDWGGLVINGSATINAAGGEVANGEGNSGPYGGGASPDDADNSGILEYVIVAYAGHVFTSEDELNGIAMQGVGNGTTVDYVQIHKNKDDGIEFFGGTVDVTHVVCTGIGDDSFDWTQGWNGRAQYVVLQQYDWDADQGIEADNNGAGHDLLPRAEPQLCNMTIIGQPTYSGSDIGTLFRAGTGVGLYHAIVTGFNEAGMDIDDIATWDAAFTDDTYTTLTGTLNIENCLYFNNGPGGVVNFLEE